MRVEILGERRMLIQELLGLLERHELGESWEAEWLRRRLVTGPEVFEITARNRFSI